jgi:hypothetical protein
MSIIALSQAPLLPIQPQQGHPTAVVEGLVGRIVLPIRLPGAGQHGGDHIHIGSNEQDPSQVPELLTQIEGAIECFVGDGIYDQEPVYRGCVRDACNFSYLSIRPAKFTYLDSPASFLSL